MVTLSPSLNPSSTKSSPVVVIAVVADPEVAQPKFCWGKVSVFKLSEAICIVIELAFASVVSVIAPTFFNLFAI